MGYNGSNRKGAKSSMFSKRNSKNGNKLISGLLAGLIVSPFAMTNSVVKSPNYSKLGYNDSKRDNADSNGCVLIVALFLGVSLFILGLYWVQLPYGYAILNFLGTVCIIISAIVLISAIIGSINEHKTIELNTKLSDTGSYNYYKPAITINDTIQNKLLSDFSFEMLFHFTQPLINEINFTDIKFSERFKKYFPTYSDYKKQWDSTYWQYSFHMKVYEILKNELETKPTLNTINESLFYSELHQRILSAININEKNYYDIVIHINGGSLSSFLSYYEYLSYIEKLKDIKSEAILFEDMNERIKDIASILYYTYTGTWKSEYIKIFRDEASPQKAE